MLILQSCANSPPVQSSQNTLILNQQHLKNIAQIKQFSLKGRIGLQASGQGFSGQLHWQHKSDRDDIALYSPFGGQVANIVKTEQQVTLTDAKGNSVSAADTQTLMQTTLGWQIPLTGLADWSLGRPSDAPIESSTWDAQGRLLTLLQDHWKIEYQQYADANGYALPSKMSLRKDDLYLKLVIDEWEIIH